MFMCSPSPQLEQATSAVSCLPTASELVLQVMGKQRAKSDVEPSSFMLFYAGGKTIS